MSAPFAGLTDSHAHLTSEELLPRAESVLAAARAAGVARVLTVSCRRGDAEDVAAFAGAHDGVLGAAGVHPHEASGFCGDDVTLLRRALARPRMAALGETGLDFHHMRSRRDEQEAAFRAQVRLARELGLPVIVHSREAEEETARILEEERADEVGGVLHCFTSSWRLAERALALGLAVSFSGIVTFPNAQDLRDSAVRVPPGSLLVETDCPWLSPVPFRGKGPNEPARIEATARLVAGLRGQEPAAFVAETNAAFERVFLRGASGGDVSSRGSRPSRS